MSGCGYMYVSVGARGGHKGALDFPGVGVGVGLVILIGSF